MDQPKTREPFKEMQLSFHNSIYNHVLILNHIQSVRGGIQVNLNLTTDMRERISDVTSSICIAVVYCSAADLNNQAWMESLIQQCMLITPVNCLSN